MSKDYYALLGVSRSADEKEIKSAYRKLARKLHPDVNPNDKVSEARFKEVSEAYEVIGDPEKRKLYDQYGHNWEAASKMGDVGPNMDFGGVGGGGGFEQIFETFFGGGRGGGRGNRVQFDFGDGPRDGSRGGGFNDFGQAQPRDIEKTIEVPLEEIDSGTKRLLTYQTMDAQRTRDNIATVPTTKKIEVSIPAGTANGRKLRVPGKGAAGVNGKGGDLFVTVKWAAHPSFRMVDDHLETDAVVPFTTAALGGEVKVATLRGKVTVKIPAGSQSGQSLRLGSQGLMREDGRRCDLIARIKITVPKQLTDRERELLMELRKIGEERG
ncbi:MAG: DnaJ C-terminal domain-containing protein [Fimbriimonas sp.]